MRVEIDQSGKLENTNKPTVVGFSNGINQTVIISAVEKQKLQRHFRKSGKSKLYIYSTFAVLIYCLLKRKKQISQVIIDREYPGQESLIKSYLLTYFRKTKLDIDKRSISFTEIGKAAAIHGIVWRAYNAKRADIRLTAKEIIKLIFE